MTIEEIRLLLAEVIRGIDKLKESSAATDRQQKETDRQLKETDRQLKESNHKLQEQLKLTDRQLRKLARQVGGLHNRWGKIIEDLVTGDLIALLRQLDLDINHASTRVRGDNWEIDVLAEDTTVVVPTEVKTTLQRTDIDNFITRILVKFTQLIPSHRNKKIYGAIAFVKTDGNESEVVNYALSKGLIVIKAMRGTNQLLTTKNTVLRDYCST